MLTLIRSTACLLLLLGTGFGLYALNHATDHIGAVAALFSMVSLLSGFAGWMSSLD